MSKRKREKSLPKTIGADAFCLVATHLNGNDLRALSIGSHRTFQILQSRRVSQRLHREDRDGSVDPTFDDMTRRLQYYDQLESFEYQHLRGQLLLQFDDSDFTKALLHGPVLEHLLTLCGSNLRLARNMTDCYMFLYDVMSVNKNNVGRWDDRPPYDIEYRRPIDFKDRLRLDDSGFTDRWHSVDQGLLWVGFDDFFAKEDYPELSAFDYVYNLISGCHNVFADIQCKLSLRMRNLAGECEIGGCGSLLEDMHMTATVPDFKLYLQALHKRAVQETIANRRPDFPLPPDDPPDNILSHKYYALTPTGVYTQDHTLTYGYRSAQRGGAMANVMAYMDTLVLCASFLDWPTVRLLSTTSHSNFDMLQRTRANLRLDSDIEKGVLNEDFDDIPARLKYYDTLESFKYKSLVGQLLLGDEDGEDEGEFIQAILHGPVMEHLLTACTARGNRANLRKARRVTECYTFLYNVISVGCNDDGITHIPLAQRMDDHDFYGRWDEDDNGLWICFDALYNQKFFPYVPAEAYVDDLIHDCRADLRKIQCGLTLRMRHEDGECELEASAELLENMHMTTTVDDFIEHLQTWLKTGFDDPNGIIHWPRDGEEEATHEQNQHGYWTPTAILLGDSHWPRRWEAGDIELDPNEE
jgi:hypothetical protein